MRKSQVAEVLSRRLNIPAGRVDGLIMRLSDAGMIPKAEGARRYPPEVDEADILKMVLAVIADRGLGNVKESVEQYWQLSNEHGRRFGHLLNEILFGPPSDVGHVILRHDPVGVSLTLNGQHTVFGAEAPVKTAAKASIVPGYALTAIAAELQGHGPSQADSMIELARLRRAFQ
ncbi:hypothetical protein HB779_06135 [Phyllobacterium sp. 628]|uniref:hypothetical protein n=1 Tax=Phyllobacterium sp. 628 TaxID=2718938 RepID=UPI0016625598|nr:hypothetical protein [Phyllobacterium sp. 628]QND51526.1 hypothetical protein HB779_06135 [Phyllobacterium sp. 628]